MLILPRQARDKHRENSTTGRFLAQVYVNLRRVPELSAVDVQTITGAEEQPGEEAGDEAGEESASGRPEADAPSGVTFGASVTLSVVIATLSSLAGKKTPVLRDSVLKMIILPRQARDKHRESTQKRGVFSYSQAFKSRPVGSPPEACGKETTLD
jgi:hypothetical protein